MRSVAELDCVCCFPSCTRGFGNTKLVVAAWRGLSAPPSTSLHLPLFTVHDPCFCLFASHLSVLFPMLRHLAGFLIYCGAVIQISAQPDPRSAQTLKQEVRKRRSMDVYQKSGEVSQISSLRTRRMKKRAV